MRKRLALGLGTLGLAAALVGGGVALAAETPGQHPGPVPSGSFSRPPRPSFSVPARPSFSRPPRPSESVPVRPSFSRPPRPSGSVPVPPSFSRPPRPSGSPS